MPPMCCLASSLGFSPGTFRGSSLLLLGSRGWQQLGATFLAHGACPGYSRSNDGHFAERKREAETKDDIGESMVA